MPMGAVSKCLKLIVERDRLLIHASAGAFTVFPVLPGGSPNATQGKRNATQAQLTQASLRIMTDHHRALPPPLRPADPLDPTSLR